MAEISAQSSVFASITEVFGHSAVSLTTLITSGSLNQWRSQVIGIGRAPAVRLSIALTTLALAHTYTGQTLAGHVGACMAKVAKTFLQCI